LENGEERRGETHDPGERQQQENPRNHGQCEANGARAGLLAGRKFARQDADENDIVDPEDDLENRQCKERDPSFGRGNPVHALSLALLRSSRTASPWTICKVSWIPGNGVRSLRPSEQMMATLRHGSAKKSPVA